MTKCEGLSSNDKIPGLRSATLEETVRGVSKQQPAFQPSYYSECRILRRTSKFDLRTSNFALHKFGCGLKGMPNSAWTSIGFAPMCAALNFHCLSASMAR